MIMADGINNNTREENDFYPTIDTAATRAIIEYLEPYLAAKMEAGETVLFREPACGDGQISQVIAEYGYNHLSTDLIDRGYGVSGVDYLKSEDEPEGMIVLTNPPFKIAREFVLKALADGADRVYLLLKSTYFQASSRIEFFEGTPISRIIPLSWRIDWTGEGSPTMECCWFEWIKGYKGEPVYGQILRKSKIVEKKCDTTLDLFEK